MPQTRLSLVSESVERGDGFLKQRGDGFLKQ
jgi:hypothetical protein